MTRRQKRFCDEYLIDLNATQAAIRSGYSEITSANASRWLDEGTEKYNREMATYIGAQLARMHSERTADAQEVMEYLTRVMRREEVEYVPQTVMDGGGVSHVEMQEIPCKVTDANKAAELLGRRFAMFTDNVQASVKMPTIIVNTDGSAELDEAVE